MAFKQPFTTGSESITTFDFTERITGLGVQKYYLYQSKDVSTISYSLTETILQSQVATLDLAGVSPSTVSFDFDTPIFQIAQTTSGSARFTFDWAFTEGQAGQNAQGKIYIRHWDGTTETDLGSAQTKQGLGSSGDTESMVIPLTKKHFAVGDILRVTVEVTYTGTAGAPNGAFVVGTNPEATDGDLTTLYMPWETID